MTDDRLTPTDAHEQLDHAGLLDAAHGPGCYALRLSVPDTHAAVVDAWDATHDVRPGGSELADLAAADRVAYVGASGNVYERIMDHARGDKRKATYLEAFPPVEVVDVFSGTRAFTAEWNNALELARDGWAVCCDGEVLVR